MDDEGPYFTLVFEGDIRKFKDNPLKTETPFGVPVAAGIGNAFDVIEKLEDVDEAATTLRQALDKYFQR